MDGVLRGVTLAIRGALHTDLVHPTTSPCNGEEVGAHDGGNAAFSLLSPPTQSTALARGLGSESTWARLS
jgi:hypothetical protein